MGSGSVQRISAWQMAGRACLAKQLELRSILRVLRSGTVHGLLMWLLAGYPWVVVDGLSRLSSCFVALLTLKAGAFRHEGKKKAEQERHIHVQAVDLHPWQVAKQLVGDTTPKTSRETIRDIKGNGF